MAPRYSASRLDRVDRARRRDWTEPLRTLWVWPASPFLCSAHGLTTSSSARSHDGAAMLARPLCHKRIVNLCPVSDPISTNRMWSQWPFYLSAPNRYGWHQKEETISPAAACRLPERIRPSWRTISRRRRYVRLPTPPGPGSPLPPSALTVHESRLGLSKKKTLPPCSRWAYWAAAAVRVFHRSCLAAEQITYMRTA
jgi:hypothetical protein